MYDVAKFNFVFTLGFAVGVLSTWGYLKKKYEILAQEEINSVKSVFSKKNYEKQGEKITEALKDELNDPDYKVIDEVKKYDTYMEKPENDELKPKNDRLDKPYVISPDAFGEFENYERIGLIYYSDNVLTDEDDEIVDDIENIVGFEALSHFGEYEEDSVYVRNDRIKCDFEILKDNKEYGMEEK